MSLRRLFVGALALLLLATLVVTVVAGSQSAATAAPQAQEQARPQPASPGETKPALTVKAKSAVLMDYGSGEVLFAHNPDARLPVASVQKIMTMTIILEALQSGRIKETDMVTTSALARSMGGTQIWLEEGEQMSVHDLLYAIAVGSANDAAVAMAEYISGSMDAFVAEMNAKARELGMTNTHFVNPTGLDADGQYSSARDLAILSRYAIRLPRFLELTSTWDYYVRKGTEDEVWLTTFNKLLKGYPGYDGIKTGFTSSAGYCLASTAKRDGLRMIAVVLAEPTPKDRTDDVVTLLNYGFSQYTAKKMVARGEYVGKIQVAKGRKSIVEAVAEDDVYVSMKRSAREKAESELSTQVVLPDRVVAPVKKGQVLGRLLVKRGDGTVAETNVIAADDVSRGSFFGIIVEMARQVFRSLFRLPN